MDRKIVGIFLAVGILIVGYLIFSKINTNNRLKEISEFNEMIMNAAEEYIEKNIDYYPEFIEIGDRAEITVQEIIDDGILKSGIDNPTKKEFSDIVIRLTIETDQTIKYEVLE